MNIPQILENEIRFINSLGLEDKKKSKLYMSIYRLFTLDSQIYSILHASTAITQKGNAIAFGDGIDCLGKSTASIILASTSNKYVMDETTLYNQVGSNVYGNAFRGINIREDVLTLVEELYGKTIAPEEGSILPERLGLEVVDSIKLSAIVCPHPNKEPQMILEKDVSHKRCKISITVNAHRLKLQEASLDRINAQEGEKPRVVEIIDYTRGLFIPDGLMSIPYYDLFYQTPEQLINLIEREGL